jgi:TP901 family phage tail tape measure protein
MHEDVSVGIIVRAKNEAEAILKGVSDHLGGIAKAAAVVGVAAVALGVGIAAASVKMAGDFQQATDAIVTGAGEDVKNLELIRAGLLRLAPEVGKTPKELSDGLYFIESAGFHAAQGLEVLRASAIAAKVGEADMATVSDALTSALNAYHLPASAAYRVTDQLLATVAAGKMHMSDLASNIGKVLPVAALTGISLKEVGAAMATMTSQGTDASMATTSLRFLLMAMINPTSQAASGLKAVGLSAKEVFDSLKNPSIGLHGALQTITEHINAHFTPGSQQAAAALAQIVGGTRGMTAALELSGVNMATFTGNLKAIGAASTGTGKTMEGWQLIQTALNTQISKLQAAIQVAGIEIGTRLLPVATQFAAWAADMIPKLVPVAIAIGTTVVTAVMDLVNAIQTVIGIGAAIEGFLDRFKVAIEIAAGVITFLMLPSILRWAASTAVDLGLSIAASIEQLVLHTRAIVTSSVQLVVANARTIALAVAHTAVAIATGVWTAAQWLLNVALSANPIALIVIGIALLIGVLILAYQHSAAFREVVQTVWAEIQKLTGVVLAVVAAIMAAITGFLPWLGQELPKIPEQFGFALGFAIGRVIRFGTDLQAWASSAIPAAVGAIIGFFAELPGRLWDVILTILRRIFDFEVAMGAWITTAIPAAVNAIVGFFSSLPGRIWGVLMAIVANLMAAGPRMAGEAASAGSAVFTAIWDAVKSLPGSMWQLGVDIVHGIWNGITGMANWLKNQAMGFAKGVLDGIKKGLGISSPSLVAALEVGVPVVTGIAQGITDRVDVITDAIRAALPKSMAAAVSGGAPSLSLAPAMAAAGAPAPESYVPPGGGRELIFIMQLNGRELGRAVLQEADLLLKLRGGNLSTASG